MSKSLLIFIFLFSAICHNVFGLEQGEKKETPEQPVVLKNYVLPLEFDERQSILTPKQKEKIRVFMNSIRFEGNVQFVKIAVWPDKPFPPEKGILFTREDKELASARIERIGLYLDDLEVRDIMAYNMALNSERLAARLYVDPEELVSLFRREGVYEPESADVKAFLEHGGASRGVIFARVATPVLETPKQNQK